MLFRYFNEVRSSMYRMSIDNVKGAFSHNVFENNNAEDLDFCVSEMRWHLNIDTATLKKQNVVLRKNKNA